MGACGLRERSNPRRPHQAFAKLSQHFRGRGSPCGLQDALSTLRPSCSPLSRLRHGRKTRYGWVAHPYPTRTFTLPETPSLSWRENATLQARGIAGARQLDRDKARCNMHVSSSPPLRTGLAALTAPGSAPVIALHGMTMKRRFPFLQFHEYPPVDSLRVHWVPLVPSSHRLGAFAISPHPGVHGFPVRRLLCPIRLSPEASSLREAFPPHSFPTALNMLRGASRVPPGRRKQNDVGGVFISLPRPLFAAPQSLDRG